MIDDEKIADVKAKHPSRSLHLVELVDGDDTYSFLMTGPNKEEYKKFITELSGSEKDFEKGRVATERAALAQIRYPERAEVQALFERKPGLVMSFAKELMDAAGASAEVRTKKL